MELGRAAESRSCRDFATTVKALALTVLLSLPGLMLIYYVAWRLSYSSSEFTAFVHALSDNLFSLAFYYLALEFMRQTFRSHGLAESHFEGYSPEIAKIYRRSLQVMIVVFLPAVFVGEIIRSSGVPAFDFTVGRLFFLIALLALVYAYDSVARPTRRRIQYFGDPDLAQRKWLSVLIYASILMLTAVAAVSALSGYYFGAWSLLKSCFHLMILMFLLMFVGSMLHRWVRVERRALAYQQAMERLARARETEEKEGSEIEDIIVDENEVDIRQIDDQSKRLIRSLTLIVGFFGLLWAIKDLLPAFSILNQFQLWQKQSLDGAIVWVTLSDLLLAIVVFIITAQMTKNLPGLLEMLVFKRLNMDSSIRYAIGKLSSYTMAAVGIIVGFNLLGLTWSKAQWLIAALGVGLGFGLQEIFANFVAGIILLFERPIRVGDVITLGDTTGVVTRIQIRATTIRNWDRQDLVVPNRDLITNQFLNWTLSGTLNRIVFNVGVAYGSDIRKARSILLDILAEHPNVMDQPGPLVTFEEFGDSSLNLVVRAYLPEVDDRLSTIDGLHTVIHDRFAKAGIEIPFPQRDLHVRSIEDVVKTQAKEGSLESGFTTD